jgi:hypothetical protein
MIKPKFGLKECNWSETRFKSLSFKKTNAETPATSSTNQIDKTRMVCGGDEDRLITGCHMASKHRPGPVRKSCADEYQKLDGQTNPKISSPDTNHFAESGNRYENLLKTWCAAIMADIAALGFPAISKSMSQRWAGMSNKFLVQSAALEPIEI